MSLYGLDVIIDKEGKYFINEINGTRSGMVGFSQLYGDNRVQEQVFRMLKEKYGELSVNDGSYEIKQFIQKHSILSKVGKVMAKIPQIRGLFTYVPQVLVSHKAHLDWISDEAPKMKYVELPFPIYEGQESTVINIKNDPNLPHQLVNLYINEELTQNKFLQYQLLKDTQLRTHLPFTTLLGLGATSDDDLQTLLSKHNRFIIKPILGDCGKGVVLLNRKELKKHLGTGGSIDDNIGYSNLYEILLGRGVKGKYLEDFIVKNDYNFELGISIVQPFINSKKRFNNTKKEYSSVRAIICNGKFIDAYSRVSSSPRVNLSQDAYPVQFKEDDFAEFCEDTIRIYEDKCSKLEEETFREKLYASYFKSINRESTNSLPLIYQFVMSQFKL